MHAPSLFLGLLLSILGPGCNSQASTAPQTVQFDAMRAWSLLERQVALGPRPAGSEAIEKNRLLIHEELASYGLEPQREEFTPRTPRGEIEMANVYADLEGLQREGKPAPMIVLVSHFDTKRLDFEFVGANDGASSTAVLLELARVLSARGPHRLTYRFLFVDGEEATREQWIGLDNTYGSRHHAKAMQESGLDKRVRLVVVLDLVGDQDLRLNTDSNSDRDMLELFFATARDIGLGGYVDGERIPISDDHISFQSAGMRAIDLIDLEFGPNNEYWHTANDTLEHCSADSLDVIGRIVLASLKRLEQQLP